MSDLVADFENAKKRPIGTFEGWLLDQPADQQKTYLLYAGDAEITTRAFFDIVRGRGAKVGRERLTAWRKGHGLTH